MINLGSKLQLRYGKLKVKCTKLKHNVMKHFTTNYFHPSVLTLLAAEEPSIPSSISSLNSFLIRRPPCSQASGVYHVLSWTVLVITLVRDSSLRSSSFIS